MKDQLKQLVKIAKQLSAEVRRRNDDGILNREDFSVDDIVTVYVHVNMFTYDVYYDVCFWAGNKTRAKILYHGDGKIDIDDYSYFSEVRMNKLILSLHNALPKLIKTLEKRLGKERQERISELEKELAKLKV